MHENYPRIFFLVCTLNRDQWFLFLKVYFRNLKFFQIQNVSCKLGKKNNNNNNDTVLASSIKMYDLHLMSSEIILRTVASDSVYFSYWELFIFRNPCWWFPRCPISRLRQGLLRTLCSFLARLLTSRPTSYYYGLYCSTRRWDRTSSSEISGAIHSEHTPEIIVALTNFIFLRRITVVRVSQFNHYFTNTDFQN